MARGDGSALSVPPHPASAAADTSHWTRALGLAATCLALARRVVPERLRPLYDRKTGRAVSVANDIAFADTEAAGAQRMALFAFAVRVLSAAIAYGGQVFLARLLGGYEYGIFVLVWVSVVILGGLACLGFPSAVVRFVPDYLWRGDRDGVRGVVWGARVASFAAATGFAALGLALLWLLGDRVSSIYVWPFVLGLVCLPMIAVGDTQDGTARAFSFKGLALVPTFLLRPVLVLVFVGIAVLLGWPATARTALFASVVATWTASLVQMLGLERAVRAVVGSGARAFRPRLWLLVALPIFLVEGFFQLLTNVDILMVGRFMAPMEVAVYFAAVKTLALVHFVYFAVKAGAAQRYAHYHAQGDRAATALFVSQTVKWTFWPSLAMSALVLALSPLLLALFGEGFERGVPLLFVLVVGIVARAAVGPAEALLTMSGQQNSCAVLYGVTLVINVALNLALLPSFGLVGAAAATTCALVFEAFALYALVLRRLGLHMFVVHAHRGAEAAA